MRINAVVLSLVGLLVLAGCASSESVVVRPGYEGDLEGPILLGVLSPKLHRNAAGADAGVGMSGSMSAQKSSTVVYLTQQGRKAFRQFAASVFASVVSAQKVVAPDADAERDSLAVAYQSFSLPGSGALSLPIPTGTVRIRGDKPNFLLIVDDLYFNIVTRSRRGPNLVSTNTSYDYYLRGQWEYLLWDADAGKVAAYGLARQTVSSGFEPGTRDYLDLLWSLAEATAKESPLPWSGAVRAGAL